MTTGKKLRLAGKGEPSPMGGPPGDLFIQAKVFEDPVFSVDGQDLHTHRDLKLSEVIFGTKINVPTPDGRELSLKIPPGTKHGTKMRLSGHGLPSMKGKKRGDIYVRIRVIIPKSLTREQKKLFEKLAETGL
jgi:curved DNA-binding protein